MTGVLPRPPREGIEKIFFKDEGQTDVIFGIRKARFAIAAGMMAVWMMSALPAGAQWATGTTGFDYRPRISTAEEVAITQHVLSADPPSATEWARHSREYKEANDFDREAVLDIKRREYIEKFRLFAKPETLVVSANVRISRYSDVNKGFIIESFDEHTFFAYNFAGQSYAIVIPKLMDYQWVSIEKEHAEPILEAAAAHKQTVNVVLEVEPKSADKEPIELAGRSYRLLAAEVASISIYAPRSNRALWSRNGTSQALRARGDIMNFYGRQ